MAKITLPTIAAGYASNAAFNTAFGQIDAEFQSKVLYRDNPSGEPNTMQNLLDMNSNAINNVTMLTATGITVAGVNLTAKVAEAATSATAAAASAASALSSKNSAAATKLDFDKRYLGAYADGSIPSTGPGGTALITGALYFNTTSNQIFSWTSGDAWVAIKPTSSEQTAITAVAADATDIGAVAGKATEIGRLGTSAAVADLALLGTTAIVADMALLASTAVIADMAILGSDVVIADMAILATAPIVADMAILGTTDVVNDMNVLGTSATVAAMNVLGTSAVVTDMGILGTAAIVEDMGILGTSGNVTAMGLLGTSGNISAMNTLGTSANVTNMTAVASNISGVNSFADLYRGAASSDPGGSVTTGSLYYNTSGSPKQLKIYDGSNWVNAAFAGGGAVTAFNGRNGSVTLLNADVVGALSTGAIATAKIANDAITADKLANSINSAIAANSSKTGITTAQANAITANTAKTGITSAQTSAITANSSKVTNATHSGEVTGSGALTIANNAVTKAKVNFVSDSSTAGLTVKGTSGVVDGYIQLNCSENSHGIKIKSPPHSAGASYTLTLPNNDGDADQVLKTNGSGVTSWGTISSVPSAVKKTFNLAGSGSPAVTAGRGVSLATDGTVGILPTSNAIGSTITQPSMNGGLSSTKGWTSDGSKWIKAVASGTGLSRILTLTGYSVNTSGVVTTGGTTVTVKSENFCSPGGVVWIMPIYQCCAIDNDKILMLSGGASVTNGGGGSGGGNEEFESKYRVNIISIADNGNVSKSSDYLAAHQGPRVNSWPTYLGHGISKISDTQYHLVMSNDKDYQEMSKIVTVSGTAIASSADNGAPGAAADLMLQSSTGFRASTWYNTCQNDIAADIGANPSYLTTGNKVVAARHSTAAIQIASISGNALGSASSTTVISDAANVNTIRWCVLANALWMARYTLTGTNEIVYRTFSINESTGALTSVYFYNTNTLESKNNPYDLETFRAQRAGLSAAAQTVVGVGIYDVGGVQSNIINSMSVSAAGQILGFNTGGSNLFVNPSDRELVNYMDGVWWYSYRASEVTYTKKYTVNAAATPPYNHVGFASASSSSGAQSITVAGVATGFSSLTIGKLYYTDSLFTGQVTISSSSGNLVGKAISATEILLNRNP